MSQRTSNPELRKYMDRKVFINIQANRAISGVLRGFDIFLNLVVEQAFEELPGGTKVPIGTIVIRGNSVSSLELVDTAKVWQDRTAPGGLAVGGVQRMET